MELRQTVTQDIEEIFTILGPGKGNSLLSELMEWLGNLSETFDKPLVIIGKTKKLLY